MYDYCNIKIFSMFIAKLRSHLLNFFNYNDVKYSAQAIHLWSSTFLRDILEEIRTFSFNNFLSRFFDLEMVPKSLLLRVI